MSISTLIFSALLLVTIQFDALATETIPWSEQEKRILASLQLSKLAKKPEARSNRFAYNTEAAAFGKQLFFDPRFSADGSLSCASCHQEDRAYTDGLIKARGVHRTSRNTQSILGAAYADWFYWDGRKDSLWSQALVPFEAADEMGSTRVKVLRIIAEDANYNTRYRALFGELPAVVFKPAIEDNSGPWGDATARNNWLRLPLTTRKLINKAYANVGKAIAAYERTLQLPSTQFDTFVATLLSEGEDTANRLMSRDALAGAKLFIDEAKTPCLRCHNGPLLSNSDFHNIGSGRFEGEELDFGRYLGIQAAVQDEFNCLGDYSDADETECGSIRFLPRMLHGELQGAFKTPSLRYLDKTAPYFHDGRYSTLEQVVHHYNSRPENSSELPEITLSDDEERQLVAFLRSLSAYESAMHDSNK